MRWEWEIGVLGDTCVMKLGLPGLRLVLSPVATEMKPVYELDI